MGTLTDDITRLCGEMVALRESREELLNALARASKDRGREVAQMLAGFRDVLARVAKEGKANRVVSVSNIRNAVTRLVKSVSDLRRGLAADIEGAHKAWFGLKADARPRSSNHGHAETGAQRMDGKAERPFRPDKEKLKHAQPFDTLSAMFCR